MGVEKNLLISLPKTSRDVKNRKKGKTFENIRIARQFDFQYFDGDRKYGYGGYYYDGRWKSVAKEIVREYGLSSGMRVLDVGCAKGFLVKDLMLACPGLQVFGIDISEYAVFNAEKTVIGRLHKGNAVSLPFPNDSFELILSINTLHNLDKNDVITALGEIQRVSSKNAYVVVDSYTSIEEKNEFEDWVLTAKFHDFPSGWLQVFKEAGYEGDYSWTILSTDDN